MYVRMFFFSSYSSVCVGRHVLLLVGLYVFLYVCTCPGYSVNTVAVSDPGVGAPLVATVTLAPGTSGKYLKVCVMMRGARVAGRNTVHLGLGASPLHLNACMCARMCPLGWIHLRTYVSAYMCVHVYYLRVPIRVCLRVRRWFARRRQVCNR